MSIAGLGLDGKWRLCFVQFADEAHMKNGGYRMFAVVKKWDNRKDVRRNRLPTIHGRNWTRRIQWLEDFFGVIKLKCNEGTEYNEIGVHTDASAQKAWEQFKAGGSFESLKSICDIKVVPSKKAGEQ
jgi:hypothetical protein